MDLRGWEWRYLWQFCQSDAQSILKEPDDKYGQIRSVTLSADEKWAAVGDYAGGRLSVHNLQTREIIRVPAGDDSVVKKGGKNMLGEWNVATGRETRSFDLPESFQGGALSPDGTQVMFVVDGDAASWTLDLISGRVSRHNMNTPGLGRSPALSSDAKFLAVPSEVGFVNIFDTATYRATATLSGFMFGVHSAGYSPDQQRLAIGSTVHEALTIWDVNNHERLLTLAAPVGMFQPVQFSPDGNVVVGNDPYGTGSLHFWRAPSLAEIEQAEAKQRAEGSQP